MSLEIKTAAELVDPALEARWAARRADRQSDVLRAVLRRFVARPGPVPVTDVVAALPDRAPPAVREAVASLDAADVLLLQDDRVELAYPFSGRPTAFRVILPGDQLRYACCAIDALGIAAMLRAPIGVRSACHHCGAPLAFSADADGPGPDARGIMAWVASRGPGERRVATSL